MLSDALPLLVSVTVCVALEVPTGTLENVRLAGDNKTLAPTPVPLKVM